MNEELLRPIPGDSPGGVPIRYEPVYDRIKEARREDDPLLADHLGAAFKEADFRGVVNLTGEALANRSKDLQLAAWRAEALLVLRGFDGLAEGLDLLRELLRRFWDSLFPEIEEDDLEWRATPLEWVGLKLGDRVRRTPIVGAVFTCFDVVKRQGADRGGAEEQDASFEQFDAAHNQTSRAVYVARLQEASRAASALNALDEEAENRFGRWAPSFSELRRSLQEVTSALEFLISLKPPDPEELAAGETAETKAPVEPEWRPSIEATIRSMRRLDPRDPTPYVLLRALRWMRLLSNSGGLPAPDSAIRTRLKALHAGRLWEELLDQCETALENETCAAWLDLQRYAVEASRALDYEAVASAVTDATAVLLSRRPSLPGDSLQDDTPPANQDTLAWLSGLRPPSVAPATLAPPAVDLDSLAREVLEQRCGRDRFLRRLELARVALDRGNDAMARAILDDLSREIEDRRLEDWESPEVVASALELQLRALGGGAELDPQRSALYARLCRVAPARALAVQSRR